MADIALAPDDALTRHRSPLRALTGIRFVAAMQVVFFHFGAAFAGRHGAPHVAVYILRNGFQAVSLFFLLSGFILAYTYAGQMHRPGALKRFFQARFARIYPVYALSLLFAIVLFRPPLLDDLYTLSMTQAWNPAQPWRSTAVNMPAWTLSVEAVFYLLFPLLLRTLLHVRARALLGVGAGLLLLIVLGHTPMDSDSAASLGLHNPLHWIPLPLWRVPEFALGLVTGLYFLRTRHANDANATEKATASRNFALLTYAAVALELVVLATVGIRWGSLLALPNIVLIYSLARSCDSAKLSWPAKLLSTRTMQLLGGASYAIYLLQLVIRLALERIWPQNSPDKEIEIAAAHLLLLLGGAIAIFLFYEEPLRRRLRGWFAKMDSAKAKT